MKNTNYIGHEPKTVELGEPILFTNNCKSSFAAGMGIMFHEDGEYLVSVHDNHMTVQTLQEGEWDVEGKCSLCGKYEADGLDAEQWDAWYLNFCPHCGARMRNSMEWRMKNCCCSNGEE